MLNVLDLFSGIGGFSLGLERTGGFKTVAFCEIEEFPRRVLAKHWPEVPCYHDVRELTAERLAADGIAVDVICGGFPCQDISLAGEGGGLDGARSSLWFEYARLIGELRPRYVLVENVSALLGRGLDRVLGSLASLGYSAEWDCIQAANVGAPHIRDRLWVVAYPDAAERRSDTSSCGRMAGSHAVPQRQEGAGGSSAVRAAVPDAGCRRHWISEVEIRAGRHGPIYGRGWAAKPNVGRVANGVPGRVDRLRGLGNAVVPQIPELIGRAILAAEAERRAA